MRNPTLKYTLERIADVAIEIRLIRREPWRIVPRELAVNNLYSQMNILEPNFQSCKFKGIKKQVLLD